MTPTQNHFTSTSHFQPTRIPSNTRTSATPKAAHGGSELQQQAVPRIAQNLEGAHLVVDLRELDEDRQRQAKQRVADHRPAAAKVFVGTDRRDESLPRVFIHVHCQTEADDVTGDAINQYGVCFSLYVNNIRI